MNVDAVELGLQINAQSCNPSSALLVSPSASHLAPFSRCALVFSPALTPEPLGSSPSTSGAALGSQVQALPQLLPTQRCSCACGGPGLFLYHSWNKTFFCVYGEKKKWFPSWEPQLVM